MKNIVEKKLNEVRATLRAMPKAFTAPKNTSDRQKLLVAITQQVCKCVCFKASATYPIEYDS